MLQLHRYDAVPNPKLGELDPKRLLGQRVTIHYNLNRCRPGSAPKPGESCFVVRDKGKTLGYVRAITLEDVDPIIRKGTIRRIRAKELRELCCFLRGTVVGASAVRGKKESGGFNPHRMPCFYLRSNRLCVDAARYAGLDGRQFWFVGAETSSPDAPKHEISARNVRKRKVRSIMRNFMRVP